jgi:hypothetical protein
VVDLQWRRRALRRSPARNFGTRDRGQFRTQKSGIPG